MKPNTGILLFNKLVLDQKLYLEPKNVNNPHTMVTQNTENACNELETLKMNIITWLDFFSSLDKLRIIPFESRHKKKNHRHSENSRV